VVISESRLNTMQRIISRALSNAEAFDHEGDEARPLRPSEFAGTVAVLTTIAVRLTASIAATPVFMPTA
jgi:hypothetical protein